MELTEAISDYIDKKVGSLEKLIDPNDTSIIADVEVGKTTEHHQTGDLFRAEINFHMAGKTFRVEETKDDLYASIDAAKDEMSRSIVSHKNKKQDLLRKGGAKLKDFLRGFRK